MIRNFLFICLTFFKICFCFSQSFVAIYGFADVTTNTGTLDPGATPTLSGLTFGPFSAHGPFVNPSASARFSFTGWPLGGVNGSDDYSTFTGALSPTVYYEVTVAASPGYTLDLSAIAFSVRRSGTGIRHYCVRSNLDNYINNLAISTGTNPKLSALPGNFFFWNFDSVSATSDQKGSNVILGNDFKNLTVPVSFRIYAWNAESPGGSFGIDNVAFTGTVISQNPVGFNFTGLKEEKLNLYPNPCDEKKLLFVVGERTDACTLELISSAGAIIEVGQYKRNGITEFDLSELQSGIYFVRIRSPQITLVRRIVLPK